MTTYHLDVLAREEYVYSEIDGTHRRFYPTGWEEEKRPYLSKLQQSIVDFLTSRGVASQSEVAERLEVSRQLAAYHLGALERLGTVDSRYWGRFKQYYIQEKDVNDMILAGRQDIKTIIDNNTFSGLEARMKLAAWKRI